MENQIDMLHYRNNINWINLLLKKSLYNEGEREGETHTHTQNIGYI